jgi:2-oxoglutarate dehydrogenase E1 component
MPILIHGDAAFAGQGLVAETLNLSKLEGYRTGGTIHIVVNNQIGFTTNAESARSSVYATDIGKTIMAPIIHVNGNDPEAVIKAADFAFEYREKFSGDIIIDMVCYRKYGHNEADEPSYTQPLLYKKINKMRPISDIYGTHLTKEALLDEDKIAAIKKDVIEELDAAFNRRKTREYATKVAFRIAEGTATRPYFTAIQESDVKEITKALTSYPEGFNANPKVISLLKKRDKMVNGEKTAIDWAMAEALAFGSILSEGRHIRFTGQDSRRGTFSQRHAVLTDYVTEDAYIPLNDIRKDQGVMRIYDSPLSEMAVLGFEYGYSIVSPDTLTLWEAQFGDFANNAISIVDQFLACSQVKWGESASLVMLLPHSYDGQGSEHSSARLERYLQLCAQENMVVANLTTPAQYFHILRRQMFMAHKLPLILMTPKSMLRHPLAVSELKEFTQGEFRHIIDDEQTDKSKVKRILVCTGKIYYELLKEKTDKQIEDVAIVRLEQIYPLHHDLLKSILETYPNAEEYFWVQEEPKNMGAWNYFLTTILELEFDFRFKYIGRKASASTATGSFKMHQAEQNSIISEAFAK